MDGGGHEEDDALADMARLGASEDEIEAVQAILTRSEEFNGIWPWHARAVRAFLSASTQWRVVASRVCGLDYSGAAIAWAAMGITLSAEEFGQVQVIEAEATRLINGTAP